MEKLLHTATLERLPALASHDAPSAVDITWQTQLPTLVGDRVTLRELRQSDAASLFALLSTDEVARFISPPPASVEGFGRFIEWTSRQQAAGSYVCFAVTVAGYDTAVGLFQIRANGPSFDIAEWGFAVGSEFWGTGVFQEGARLAMAFAFDTLGVHRLEARAAVHNGRGNAALRKIGAVPEGLLRNSLSRKGARLDQVMYAILADEWRAMQSAAHAFVPVRVH